MSWKTLKEYPILKIPRFKSYIACYSSYVDPTHGIEGKIDAEIGAYTALEQLASDIGNNVLKNQYNMLRKVSIIQKLFCGSPGYLLADPFSRAIAQAINVIDAFEFGIEGVGSITTSKINSNTIRIEPSFALDLIFALKTIGIGLTFTVGISQYVCYTITLSMSDISSVKVKSADDAPANIVTYTNEVLLNIATLTLDFFLLNLGRASIE